LHADSFRGESDLEGETSTIQDLSQQQKYQTQQNLATTLSMRCTKPPIPEIEGAFNAP